MNEVNFSDLMEVYREGNIDNGRELYPADSAYEQLRNAEQDFYQYLQSVFFRQDHSFYAVWESDGKYQSALRLEPYMDGFLLCALETAPAARNRGLAAALVFAVQDLLNGNIDYVIIDSAPAACITEAINEMQ